MGIEEREAALRGWWLGGAFVTALASGVYAALQLMWGNFEAGGVALLLSVVGLRWPQSIWRAGRCAEPLVELPPRQRRLALLAVCAVALFFRIYRLEPPGLWGDEAVNGLRAFDILDGKVTSPFQLVAQPLTYFHALSNYPIAAAFRAFGPSITTLRLPGIIAGILAVPLLYAMVSPLFGARVALIASLFFASSPWQISHAKGLTQIVLGEFFMLFGFCALVRGVTGTRRWLIALSGIPLALCLYTYHATKLAPLVAAPYLLVVLWRGRLPRRTLIWYLLQLAVVFLLCSIPLVQTFRQNPGALTERVSGVALMPALQHGGFPVFWRGLWRNVMIFQYQQGPVYNWFGIGADPALDLLVAFLFVHGMVQSLWRWKEPRHTLLLGWMVIGLMPGVLSTDPPRAYRIFLTSPALYVWAALPLAYVYECAQRAPRGRRCLQSAVALVVAAVPILDFNYYFYRLYPNAEFRWFQAERMVDMARMLKARGPGWTGYLMTSGFDANYETMAFLSRAWGLTIRNVTSLADVVPVRDDLEGGALFMMDRTCLGAAKLLGALYTGADLEMHFDPPQRTFWMDHWMSPAAADWHPPPTTAFFPVSRRAAQAIRGVTVTFFGANERPIATRIDQQLRIEQREDLPRRAQPAVRVLWSGALSAPADGSYRFVLQAGGAAELLLDGREVVSHDAPEAMIELAQGLHPIAAVATVADAPVLRLQWQPPGADLQSIPPALLFRDADVHGLLAEYRGRDATVRRIEPYPYYCFFPPTFADLYAVHWRGQLRVPAPGYHLDVVSEGQRDFKLDGHTLQQTIELPVGVHDFEMTFPIVQGAAHLQLYWTRPDATRELIPPEAFTPPSQPTDPDRG